MRTIFERQERGVDGRVPFLIFCTVQQHRRRHSPPRSQPRRRPGAAGLARWEEEEADLPSRRGEADRTSSVDF